MEDLKIPFVEVDDSKMNIYTNYTITDLIIKLNRYGCIVRRCFNVENTLSLYIAPVFLTVIPLAYAIYINKKVTEFQQQQATMSATVREFRQQELAELEQRMQMFYQTVQKDLQAKQVEYLQPVQAKLLEAINKVAAAQNCTYVMDKASMLYIAPDALDLTPAVRAELGIK